LDTFPSDARLVGRESASGPPVLGLPDAFADVRVPTAQPKKALSSWRTPGTVRTLDLADKTRLILVKNSQREKLGQTLFGHSTSQRAKSSRPERDHSNNLQLKSLLKLAAGFAFFSGIELILQSAISSLSRVGRCLALLFRSVLRSLSHLSEHGQISSQVPSGCPPPIHSMT
jgi:hypothetical protein